MSSFWLEPAPPKLPCVIDAESAWEQARLIDRKRLFTEAKGDSFSGNRRWLSTIIAGASHQRRGDN
jgi:hypothetical protein